MKRIRTRLLISFLITALAVLLVSGLPPNLAHVRKNIHLGLDLSGGMNLVLQVVTDDAVRAETDQALESAESELHKEGVEFVSAVRTANDRFVISGVDSLKSSDLRRAISVVLPPWSLTSSDDGSGAVYVVSMDASTMQATREGAVEQSMKTIRNRIDDLGVVDPTIQRYHGGDGYEILVQLPGVDEFDRVKHIIQAEAVLELKLVDSGPFASEASAAQSYGGTIPGQFELLPSVENTFYVVQRSASLRGQSVKNAYVSRDESGSPAVTFALNAEGAQVFGRLTEQNIGQRLAIVLDRKVQEAAVIQERISDLGVIRNGSARYSTQQAADLALILRSGAMPAGIHYVSNEFIGPSLGAESIRKGVMSAGVALGLVIAFMLFYYRLAGVNATVSMVLNLIVLMGAMAYFGATLTLPGIAGIILTIGDGIDSNVLIFERIREELRTGKNAVSAVATGFDRVFMTLVDTHLAALISAVFLFLFGTGPVKGFAVTLVIGLVSNMFTAVFVSRTLFDWVLIHHEPGAPLNI